MYKRQDKEATAVEQDMLITLEVCYEFYLRGFRFERLDLYKSQAVHFAMDEEKGTLIPPFVSVAGLGETAAISLAEQSKERHFISIEEVTAACPKVSKTHIEMLKEAGAFGDMPETSQIDLFMLAPYDEWYFNFFYPNSLPAEVTFVELLDTCLLYTSLWRSSMRSASDHASSAYLLAA